MKTLFAAFFFLIALPISADCEKLSAAMNAGLEMIEYNGGVSIQLRGQTVFELFRGVSNPETNSPLTKDQYYNISSIGKEFTAATIHHLVEAKKLNVDAPIETYFPEISGKERGKITIRQILSHSSGMVGSLLNERDIDFADHQIPYQSPTADQYSQFISDLLKVGIFKQENKPGTSFSYSNYMYVVLGEIVKRVSGKDMKTYLREKILPLADIQTLQFPGDPSDMSGPELYPYLLDKDLNHFEPRVKSNELYIDDYNVGYGNQVLKVSDLHRWNRAYFNGKIFSGEAFKDFIEYNPRFLDESTNVISNYGMGYTRDAAGLSTPFTWGDKLGHTGGDRGTNSISYYFPKIDLSVVLVSNRDGKNRLNATSAIYRILVERVLTNELNCAL